MRFAITAVLAIAVIACAACGDSESEQELAQDQVCDARGEIQRQLDSLEGANLETATVDGIKQPLNAIKGGLAKIEDARSELDQQRQEQAESASRAFRAEVDQALAPIDCG